MFVAVLMFYRWCTTGLWRWWRCTDNIPHVCGGGAVLQMIYHLFVAVVLFYRWYTTCLWRWWCFTDDIPQVCGGNLQMVYHSFVSVVVFYRWFTTCLWLCFTDDIPHVCGGSDVFRTYRRHDHLLHRHLCVPADEEVSRNGIVIRQLLQVQTAGQWLELDLSICGQKSQRL